MEEGETTSDDPPLQSNDKVDLWLGGDVELARVLCRPSEPDLLALLLLVLVHVLLGTLEDHLALGLVGLR